jgi:hypothetical protein
MKAAQTMSETPTPTVPETPLAPDGLPFPEGLDNGILSLMFGMLRRSDGKRYSFNPAGVISKAWYIRGKAQNRFPFLYQHFEDTTTGREYFVFSDGSTIWRPERGARYRWG